MEYTLMSRFIEAARWLDQEHQNKANFINFNNNFGLSKHEDAYEVQDALEEVWSWKGKLAGYKLALTSKPIQALFGVDKPMRGNIFSKTVLYGNKKVAIEDYVHLGVEFELAVEIGEDFGANCKELNVSDCISKVAAVYPAFELIDDRNADYSTVDLISATADNSWNRMNILGNSQTNFKHLDFGNNLVTKTVNENKEKSVTGAALGNPFNSVLWIANSISERGKELRKGQIIMTGSTFATYFPYKGDKIIYEVEGIGEISIEIE